MKKHNLISIAWIFIYIFAFGLNEYIIKHYISDNNILIYYFIIILFALIFIYLAYN